MSKKNRNLKKARKMSVVQPEFSDTSGNPVDLEKIKSEISSMFGVPDDIMKYEPTPCKVVDIHRESQTFDLVGATVSFNTHISFDLLDVGVQEVTGNFDHSIESLSRVTSRGKPTSTVSVYFTDGRVFHTLGDTPAKIWSKKPSSTTELTDVK